MKRTSAVLLIIGILLMLFPQPVVFAQSFPDVTFTHPNYIAVKKLSENGIVAGYDDGTFQPDKEITRTEFCALLARMLGFVPQGYAVKEVPFSDVGADYWGVSFISYCYERGLINGMGDGTFAPADKVTLAQAIKMAVCAMKKEAEALEIEGENWYSGYVEVASKYRILKSISQEPDENAMRCSAAQIVYNVAMYDGGVVNYDELMQEYAPEFAPTEDEIDELYENKDYSYLSVILLDPGHNYRGKDIGARIDELGVREEIITWQISDKLRFMLEEMGYTVYMTRENLEDSIANTSTTESLQARVDLAHAVLADLYISIHCNMGGGTGTETYCFDLGGQSAHLAKYIQKNITEATGFYNRGVKTANFFVIKNTAMPSVLVETGFLDMESDREVLLSEEGQEIIARAIADAVAEYAESLERQDGAAAAILESIE
ncbi:MAG: N-acetylmuramoyl-L-alanine amidase [Clostridia bacterium]|nr:N-acetylmuramoyl-L-alanine amidase [Clostridia bacterium]